MAGKKNLASSVTRLEALDLSSSAYGVCIPIVGGVTRVAGNLIYYNDFKSTPQSSQSGGKGGSAPPTGYTYTASCIMAICRGQIADIPRVWVSNAKYPDATGTGAVLGNATPETYAVPSGGGGYSVTHSAVFGANTKVTAFITTPARPAGYTVVLALGKDYTVDSGVYSFPLFSQALGHTVTIYYTYLTSIPSNSAMSQLGMTMLKGAMSQVSPSWVTSLHPADAMNYPGLAGVTAQNYTLNDQGGVDNHNFEVVGPGAYSLGPTIPDIDPAAFTVNVLLDLQSGAGFPTIFMGDHTDWSHYCIANNFLMSPCLDSQVAASDFLKTMSQLTNTGFVWSGMTLKMVPYADTPVTGNGVTYTPNVTPIYSLTDDAFITSGADNPVQVTRVNPAKAYNDFRIQFKNRNNGYADEIAEAQDRANVEANTLRQADIVTADYVNDATIARNIAQTMVQRSVYVRATYQFSLPWNFAFLEPMDLVSITDLAQGFNNYAVRITEIDENNDQLDFTAEDFIQGVAHTATYGTQVGAGFAHNYNEIPGSINAPVIFEAPRSLSGKNGLDVWVAANSSSTTWGGCNVWMSLDGVSYKNVGKMDGGSRFGAVVTDSGATLAVGGMTGALNSGSAADSSSLSTLCYVDGATPEYLAYQTATLTGTAAYTLSGLTRPAYSTTQTVHAGGVAFVRCDTALLKGIQLDGSYVGKTLYFKFTSFNAYGGAEEGISAVPAYTKTITGALLRIPPAAPATFTATPEQFGIRFACSAVADPTVANYQYRVGATWATSALIEPSGGTSYLWKVQSAGAYTVWVAAVDTYGNVSTPVSATVTITVPTVTGVTATVVGPTLDIEWSAVSASFAIADYEVRFGASFAAGTSMGFYSVSSYSETIRWTTPRVYWIAAIDANGNYGPAAGITVSPAAPGPVTGQRADVVDNNVLIYWNAPSTGTFPIDHYEVRKGASWATGALIGSNGNSTFTTVFEQVAGSYTYWIAGWDTAGNMGTPVSLTATVLQPPDYILRTNYNSGLGITTPPGVLSTAVSNLYAEAGALVGPVDLTTTWATHFTSNSWTSPNDQVTAGFPLYAEPSISNGTFTEVFDYGTVLQATTVSITPTATILAGSEALTCQIYQSTDNVTYTAAAAGFSALLANFRYIKYVITVTGVPGANLAAITAINVKLSIKQRNDSGQSVSVLGGVTVPFGYPFIEADVPQIQCVGLDTHGKPWIPAVIYSGPPNPTNFVVRVYDSSGVETAGVTFSWQVRGY